MTELLTPHTESIQLLRGLFAAATHDASVAVSSWTDDLIRLTLDDVRESPLTEICDELGDPNEQLTMVTLNIEGELGGTMVLMFDQENGRRMADSLVGENSPPTAPWTELEKSALAETGNILGCAYLSAIARLIDQPLMPSPPCLVQEYGASVVEQALMGQAVTADSVLVCRAGFQYEGEKIDWFLLFVPSYPLRTAMERALT